MSYTIRVNFGLVAETARALGQNAESLKQDLKDARTKAGPLYDIWVQSGSPAASEFDNQLAEMERRAGQITMKVEKLGLNLGKAGQDQESNEQTFVQQFRKLT